LCSVSAELSQGDTFPSNELRDQGNVDIRILVAALVTRDKQVKLILSQAA